MRYARARIRLYRPKNEGCNSYRISDGIAGSVSKNNIDLLKNETDSKTGRHHGMCFLREHPIKNFDAVYQNKRIERSRRIERI